MNTDKKQTPMMDYVSLWLLTGIAVHEWHNLLVSLLQ